MKHLSEIEKEIISVLREKIKLNIPKSEEVAKGCLAAIKSFDLKEWEDSLPTK